jgi:hypothetical protein
MEDIGSVGMMVLREQTVNPVLFGMKIIEAGLKLDDYKYDRAHGNTHGQPGNIYNCVILVAE